MKKRIKYDSKFKGVILDHPFLAAIEKLGLNKKGQLLEWIVSYVLYGEKPPEEEQTKSKSLYQAFNMFLMYNEPRVEKFKVRSHSPSEETDAKTFNEVRKRMRNDQRKYNI